MLAIGIVLVVLVCGSSLVLGTNLYALRKAGRLESAGTRVEGECVSHYWPSGGYVGAVCTYSAGAGQELTVRSSRYSVPPVEVGDVVEVVHEPGRPERAMLLFEATRRVGYDTALTAVMGALWVAAVTGLLFML
ncbi:hypothetical protein DMH12_16310 [Streptomyces sp. WAC 04229]|uniref:DUF3592 domain-containing protein n=1 Tax=Streptomyces sp. WAC 04229 TaxID=2203206 RepID=UPI000F73F6FF|nr:DUF3592 domain-containing protein [Streptomyces sp. WAC 04229]RSN54788.1 hypothetical protein DMH12_16310 [Streptomyces sp. WAC 04229]